MLAHAKSNHYTCFLVLNSDDITLQCFWLVKVTWCCAASFLICYLCQWFCAVCQRDYTHTYWTDFPKTQRNNVVWAKEGPIPFWPGSMHYPANNAQMLGCWVLVIVCTLLIGFLVLVCFTWCTKLKIKIFIYFKSLRRIKNYKIKWELYYFGNVSTGNFHTKLPVQEVK